MDELKLLVDMVAHLPAMALWVIAFFFAYKVIVIGSMYGVVRFVALHLFDWLKKRNDPVKDLRATIDGLCITQDGTHDELIVQIKRLRGITSSGSAYVHRSDVEWLAQAIDTKLTARASRLTAV